MATVIKGGGFKPGTRGIWRGTFAEVLEVLEASPRNDSKSSWATDHQGGSFCSDTVEETLRKAREGYPEAVKEFDRLRENIFRVDPREAHNYLPDTAPGHFFDIGAVVAGDPDHWRVPENELTHRRTIKIFVSGTYNGGVAESRIMRRGAVIAEILDRLIVSGPVELFWCDASQYNASMVSIDFHKGDYSKNSLAFIFAHPGMLRRVGFRLMDITCGEPWSKNVGYGASKPLDLPSEPDAIVFDHEAEKDGCLDKYATDADALKEYHRLMAKIEVVEREMRGEF